MGQGVTIIICIIGIPITMLTLKTSGEVLADCFRILVVKTETGIFKRAETKDVKKKNVFRGMYTNGHSRIAGKFIKHLL